MKNLFTLFFALMATTATLFAQSGSCGANVNWELDYEGVLTIYGTGPMEDYVNPDALPWYDMRSSITSVVITDGVTSISRYMCCSYTSYTALEEVTIGNSVTSIGDYAFYRCTSLHSLTIGHSVTTIGQFAFSGCTVLPEISLPNSLTTIGESAFNGCAALTEVTIGDNVTSIGEGAFKNCTALTEVTIGNKVESIGDDAFNACGAMTSLTMGNSVTSIGVKAFFDCEALTSLTLPASLTTIGEKAFQYCWRLTEITCKATVPPSCGSEALATISTTIPVYVPYGTKSAYEGADEWKNFTNIKEKIFGSCGANVNWELTGGVLTISGTGPMTEYGSPNALPWYDWRSSIISVIVENGVTSISKNLCYSYTALEEVTIGNSVTSIGDYAFDECASLNSLTIGHSVTTIGVFAFGGCTVLPEISLPNSLITVGQSAFNGCSALTEVTIPNNVTSIGEGAFKKCTALEEVTIGDKVESIGDEAFRNCSKITSLTIGNSVTSIGQLAFFYCEALTSLTLPASLTTIGKNGFRYCWRLTEITCNATTPPSCGTEALATISTTIPVYVPYGTKSAYEGADEWKNFTNIKASVSGTCGANVNWVLDEGVLTISGTGEMDDYASEDEVPWFPYVSSITNVVIEDGVTTIGSNAFNGCAALEEVTIGNSVTSIGDLAFRYCEALITITLPENLTSIGNEAFDGCTLLQEVTIPNSVTILGAGAFRNCSSLNAVTIGSGITTIEQETFASCGLLYEVTIPDNIVVIGEDAFNNCSALTEVTIGNSVTTIGTAAFSSCYGLTSITIPENVVSIDYHAFYYCSGLTEITSKAFMPPTCASNAFDGVDNSIPVYVPYGSLDAYAMAEGWNYFTGIQLKVDASGSCGESVNWLLTDGLLVISGSGPMTNYEWDDEVPWYAVRSTITTVIIEEGVTTIGDGAFWLCDALSTVTIPNGITSIGGSAFNACYSLNSITLPSTVSSLGYGVFYDSENITQITCEATTPPSLGVDVFFHLDNSIPVYVPAEAVNTYKETEGWSYFTNILGYASGTCGASATWTLYGDVLTISGTGQMTNYSYASSRPWHAYAASITTVIVEDGITSIGESAFDGFTALTSATIGNTVEYIYGFAFIGCTELTEITLPSSLTDIYPSAFKYAGFTSLLIPENVIYIGNEAFSSCEALTEITSTATTPPSCSSTAFEYVNNEIPVIVPIEAQSAYRAAEGWNHFVNIQSTGSCGENVNWTLNGDVLTIYGTGAMAEYEWDYEVPWYIARSTITTVIIEEGVTTIGSGAFWHCDALSTVTIPNGITSIGSSAFNACYSLNSITLPSTVSSLGYGVFYDSENITEITCEATTPPTCDVAVFYGVNTDIPVYVPAGTKQAYSEADGWKDFTNIQGISRFELIDGIRYFLDGNDFTAQVVELDGEKYVGDIVVPEEVTFEAVTYTVTSVSSTAFMDCPELLTVSLPKTIDWIEPESFQGNTKLTAINVDEENTVYSSLNGVLFNEAKTELVAYPTGKAGAYVIPDGVEAISDGAFIGNVNLTAITMPASMYDISSSAFANCTGLTMITCLATDVPGAGSDAFYGVDKSIPVFVPKASIALYQAEDEWKDFTNYNAAEDKAAADEVVGKIDAIGTVVYTPGCKALIETARAAYDALPADQKPYVTNYATLTAAEAAYAELVKEHTYTVTFKDWNNATIKTQSVEEGHAASAPDDPSRDGYTFTGWDKDFSNITGDLTVKAQYELITSGACGTDGEGNLTDNLTWTYNVETNTLTIEGAGAMYDYDVFNYVYAPWYYIPLSGESIEHIVLPDGITHIGNFAFFNMDEFSAITIPSTVKVIGKYAFYGSAALTEITIPEGVTTIGMSAFQFASLLSSVTIPASVTTIGDNAFSNCTALTDVYNYATTPQSLPSYAFEKVVIAKCKLHVPYLAVSAYEKANIWKDFLLVAIQKDLTVTFVDYDATELKSETVKEGEAAIAPSDPTREGYTFTGWDKDFSKVLEDMTVTAQYAINVYTVTFVDKDGKTLKTEDVEWGNSATAPDAPAVEGYHFTNWDNSFDNVTSDLTVKAQYAINTYTVTFMDYDYAVLKEEKVEWGKNATAPAEPTREGYTFIGWNKEYNNVTEDLTVTALYAINIYTVTFIDKDGKTIKTEDVEWGNAATAPDAPAVEGYHFAGWDKAFNVVKSDLTVQATYTKNPVYTVTFKDYDGSVIATVKVEEGKAAVSPDEPIREGYTFTGWDKDFSNVTSDLTVTAQYAINVYTVKFVDKDGKTLKTEKVEHGKAATAPEAPVVAGYHFTGWDKKFEKVTSDLTVKALYEINVYTVKFVDKDGKTLKTEKVEHGKAATAPDAPAVEGYHFTGWDKKFEKVTSDLTVKALYEINVYTVTFLDEKGKSIKTEEVEHGKSATAPNAPEVKGYHFTGWDKDFSNVTSDLTVQAQYAINVYTVTFLDKDGKTIKTEKVEHGSAATAPDAPAVEGYHFTKWDKKFDKVTSNLTVQAQYAINVYTVKFVDKDDKTLKSEKVEHGKSATAPDAPAVEGYHFTGWDKKFDKVTSDLTVKALYAINTYTVTFVDYDNKELKKETVEHGKAATAPANPTREGYTFKGWDKDFSNITADLTVKAQYTINTYTVKFVDKDGKTLKTEKVEWGKAATAPEPPVVAGWTFAGWDKAFNVVKSDLTVQATYTKNPVYTVTFKDYDGSVIAEVKVEEGKSAVKPDDPIREGYTFTGWDKKFDNVKSDLTVTAQYAINTYTVTFVDYDNKELKKETVEWGKSATAPADPTREGYTFKGWDKDYSSIKSDLTVKALYAINTYTVTFVDYDNKELKKETVEHGKAATAPSNPTREGYTFKGWDKDFSNITADLTVKAQYTINTYTVTFLDKDGNTLKTEKVKYGKSATAPEPPVVEGWTFAGWDKAFNVVKSDLTVQATYTQNPVYTVTFKDWDGSVIAEVKVEEGKSAVSPDEPIREGYTFTGWDKKFDKVTSDLTVTAQYAINVYTVKFVDKDGKTLKTEKVEHGKAATAPEAPAVEGYHFTGWDKKFDKITSDLTVKALYEINVYTVKFVDKDGKTLKTEKVEHGKSATAPEAPVVEGWTFAGWDKAFNVVTSDLTVKAIYTQNHVYTVTFVDYDGSVIAEVKVEEGKSAVKPDDPIREGYTFTGWDKDFSNVTSDLTVTAQYAINVYTVKFVDKDGKTLKTEKVEHGKAATAPDAPAVEGYHFTGWDTSFDKITSDLTVKALYEINVYTVKFVDKDGKTIKTEKVEHGKAATAPEAPVVEGWTFAGWDKAFNVVKSDLTVQATYTQNTVYTVTFVDYDGSIIAEVKVEEGKAAVKPNDPIREGYTFIGWDKDFSNVTSDMTVTALYEALSDFVPQNLTVELVGVGESDTQITLSWDKVEGAFSYDLRLAIGEKELFTRNTMTLTSLTALLSQIEEQYHLTPGTYLIDWFVRSTDKDGEAISEWAQGESFEVTIKEPQGIEDVNADANTTVRKEMRNGLLYIIRGDRTYDSNGRLIQ